MNILKVLTQNRKTGNRGERAAARLLRRRGYKILEKNYTARDAEIDIIARKRNVTAFVEVKTRNIKHLGKAEARPASSVTPEKQRKIIKAASVYSAQHPSDTRLRFDVIEVYLEDTEKGRKPRIRETKHLVGAFDKDTAYDAAYYYKRKKEGQI